MSKTLDTDIHVEEALSLFALPEHPDILDWSESNVVYPHSDRCPRFSRDYAYWLNEPLRAITSGAWRVVSMMAPVGCGKTALIETLACYAVAVDKGNMLIAHQTDADSMTFGETRLLPMLEVIGACRERLPQNRHKVRKSEVIFSDMGLFLGGANVTSLQSKSCKYVVLDEAWLLKRSMLTEAMARCHDRASSVVVVVGQGGVINDEHDRLMQTCQQHVYGWSCPRCAAWHAYSFRGDLRYNDTRNEHNLWQWRELAASVRMLCKACGGEFADTESNRRLLSKSGSYRPIPCNGLPERIGFTFPSLAVWWIPWSTTVIEFVQANERKKGGDYTPLRQWIQKRLAEPWSEENEAPEVVFTASGYTMAEFEDGHEIENEVLRFLTIDRQRDHFWCVLRAWRANGSSMLLYCGRLLEWSQIPALQQKYKLPRPACVLLDCGFDPSAIYLFAIAHGYVCLRGDGVAKEFIHRNGRQIVKRFFSPTEHPLINGKRTTLFRWASTPVRDILARLRGSSIFEIPSDCPADYQAHMTAEIKREVLSKVDGTVTQRWVRIGDRRNDLWDCEAMGVVAALMSKVIRLGETPEEPSLEEVTT